MIGKQMRGIHHLVRNLDETPKHIFYLQWIKLQLDDTIHLPKAHRINNDCI